MKTWFASLTIRSKLLSTSAVVAGLAVAAVLVARDALASTATNLTAPVILGIFAAFLLGAAVVLATYVARQIEQPLKQALDMARDLSRGSLHMRLNAGSDDEIGELSRSLNAIADTLTSATRSLNAIADGNLPAPAGNTTQDDELSAALARTVSTLSSLASESHGHTAAVCEGKFTARANTAHLKGEFLKIADGANRTLDLLVGLINHLPVPVSVVDTDFRVLYMNAAAASLGGRTPAQERAVNCYDHFRTEACRTEHCPSACAMRTAKSAATDTVGRPGERRLELACSALPLVTNDGTIIGAIEMIQDRTESKNAARRNTLLAAFQQEEAQKLSQNLELVARGDLQIHPSVPPADEEIRQTREQFLTVNAALESTVAALRNVAADTTKLSEAFLAGDLSSRADTAKHQGEFRNLLEGVNKAVASVTAPAQEGAAILARMAEGDLTGRVRGDYRGEHRTLKESINTVAERLADTLTDVRTVTATAAKSTESIDASAAELAAGAHEQHAQVREVATATDAITRSISEISQSTLSASFTAHEAREAAKEGGMNVSETIAGLRQVGVSMQNFATSVLSLSDSSTKIDDIVRVIEDIADQTNLLALNAAIEAARAGEEGRGFSIVADEVRKLAERTTKATKEISGMITRIQRDTTTAMEEMGHGIDELDGVITKGERAEATLQGIVEIVQVTSDLLDEIAKASEQQASASEEVSKSIEGITAVTAQSAERTEHIAGQSRELRGVTSALEAALDQFRLSDAAADHAAAPMR